MELYGTYNEYSSKLFDTTESALVDINIRNYEDAEFKYENIYIKNSKTYTRILKDLIYLEEIYREKYVKIVFLEDKENQLKDEEGTKLIKKIKSLYYYYFVYQMYMDFRFWIANDWAIEIEEAYFFVVYENDTRYIDLIKECYYKAYKSIFLFNETNNDDFLDVEQMEKDIDLLIGDCVGTQKIGKEKKKVYMLEYLQPYKFESKDNTIRIRRATNDIQNRSTYDSSRKRTATTKQKSVMKKYYNAKENNPKLTAKQFMKNEGISESTFYYYKKKYNTYDSK